MLAKGIEPSTVRLQVGRSTIELHQQNREFRLTNFPLSPQAQRLSPIEGLLPERREILRSGEG